MTGVDWVIQPLHHAEFDYLPFRMFVDFKLPPFPEDAQIFVLRGVRFIGSVAITNHPEETFENFIAHHRPVGRQTPAAPRKHTYQIPKEERERLLAEYPWLEEDDFPQPKRRRKGPRRGRRARSPRIERESSSSDSSEGELPVHMPDELPVVLASAKERLVEERKKFKHTFDDIEDEKMWFNVRLLGGEWTEEFKGILSDGLEGLLKKSLGMNGASNAVSRGRCPSCLANGTGRMPKP